MEAKRNCKACALYQYEEISDNDFGGVYADEQSCSKYFDLDNDENYIENFDRDIERECCILDFLKVADIDDEIGKLVDKYRFGDKSYKRFKEKYNVD